MWQALELSQLSARLILRGSGASQAKKLFPQTDIHKIFETNSSFHVK